MTEMLSVFNVACARIISRTRVCSVVVAYQCWPAPMLRENTSLQTQTRDACDSLTTSACMPRETFGGVSGWSSPHTASVCSCFLSRHGKQHYTHTHASASCVCVCVKPHRCAPSTNVQAICECDRVRPMGRCNCKQNPLWHVWHGNKHGQLIVLWWGTRSLGEHKCHHYRDCAGLWNLRIPSPSSP